MRQVGTDGKLVVSPSPSPKVSPNHLLDTLKVSGAGLSLMEREDEEDEGGGRSQGEYAALLNQIQQIGMDKGMQGACLFRDN